MRPLFPRLPWPARLAVFAFALASLVADWSAPPANGVARAEFATIAVVVWEALNALFQFFRGKKSTADTQILGLRQTVTGQGNAIGDLAKKTGGWFSNFLDIFHAIWGKGLKPLISKAYDWLKRLQAQLNKWFSPVVKWLKTLRVDVLRIYKKWVRPILDTLDVVRRTLQLFALFGWDDAKKLEQKVAAIEDKISAPFLLAVKKINELIGWVDLIITGDGLFQKLALYRSLFSYRRDVIGILSKPLYRDPTADDLSRWHAKSKGFTFEESVNQMVAAATGEEVYYSPAAQEFADDTIRLMKAGGVIP